MKLNSLLNVVTIIAFVVGCALSGCGVSKATRTVENMKHYNYDVTSVQNIRIAGTPISESTSLEALPSLAIAVLQQNLPLQATVNLKILNTTSDPAFLGPFKYLIEIGGKAFVEGMVDQRLNIEVGGSQVVPMTFNANLFGVSNQESGGITGLLNNMFTRQGNGFVVLKIKPSFIIAGETVYYPGYITIDSDLLKGLRGIIK